MKAAIVLLCAFAAVQARSLQPFDDAVDSPWLVHLRVARSTGGGLLESCVGALYNRRWVLSSASCLRDARFVWIRYNAPNVFQPELVTETSRVTLHPAYNRETGENDIALLDINRDVTFTDSIKPIALLDSASDVPSSGVICGYGDLDGKAGENLQCFNVELQESDDLLLANAANGATTYDLGAPVVADGKAFGILTRAADGENAGAFLKTAPYQDWITLVAGDSEATRNVVPEEIQVAEPIQVAELRY